jgi:hypothetical protein
MISIVLTSLTSLTSLTPKKKADWANRLVSFFWCKVAMLQSGNTI